MKFYNYINEAEMLDISITNVDKIATSEDKIKQFLDQEFEISVKYDGVKINLWRNNEDFDPNDYTKNWVLSYKGNIIYPQEFEGWDDASIKKHSIGASQFKFINDHIKAVHKNTKSFSKNTVMFLEFIMNKMTLTRDYKFKHGLYLISSSPAKGEEIGGQLFTKPTKFDQSKNKKYADILELNLPDVIFKGKLNTEKNFKKGILSDKLQTEFNKVDINYDDPTDAYNDIKKIFLNVESSLGDIIEGVVLKTSEGKYFKFLQKDQHDKAKRFERKKQFINSPEEETEYWDNMKNQADQIISDLVFKLNSLNFSKTISNVSSTVYSLKRKDIQAQNNKKELINLQDDLFLTAKNKLINMLPENQNVLFMGRFQPPTKAHLEIIEDALTKFNNVVLCIVKAKKQDKDKSPFPLDLQEEMIRSAIHSNKVQIITHSTGNLISVINKSKWKIQYVLAGSDRAKSYEKQLMRSEVRVVEIKRTDHDVSATKIRNALKNDDIKSFKQNIHPTLFKYYDELKKHL